MTRKEHIRELKNKKLLIETNAELILERATRFLALDRSKWRELIREYNLALADSHTLQRKIEFLSANQGLHGREIVGVTVPKNRR